MESKVSGLLSEAAAPEVRQYIYGPRLARTFDRSFQPMTDINQAHVIMLAARGIIGGDVGKALAAVLLDLEEAGPGAFELDPALEEAYFNYEAKVIERTGPDIGGRMHIGRSRNDLGAAVARMRSRDECLDILDALVEVRRAALDRAEKFAGVVVPGYTHLQPAQPVTFGYYLLGIAQALERDHRRIAAAYPNINLNPLGTGALAGTSFPIDRHLTRELLGFDGLLEHGQDAVASRDFAVELLMACAALGLTWSRLAQDFYVMTTHEFQTISFPDRVVGTSSIMPQKKNPVVLEHLKGKSAQMMGSLVSTMAAIKGTNFSNTIDGNTESLRWYYDSLADTSSSLAIVRLVLETVEPNAERSLRLVQENFSTATELADALVREGGLSFREAHHVVGRVVRDAMERGLVASEIGADLIGAAAKEIVGREIALSEATLRHSLTPELAVEQRAGIGGPAAREVARMVAGCRERLEESRRENDARRAHLVEARARLKTEITALSGRG